MAYTKQTWVRGEKVASAKLNHMEDGIDAISANGAIDTANLADGSVYTEKLADDAVTYDKLDQNAVDSVNIRNGAVTAAKLGADVSAVLDNKANIDGSYEGMTVGNAEQLVSTVGVEDSAPYTFRTSGGSTEIGDREELNTVVGATVEWNQLALSPDIYEPTGATKTVSNGVITLTANSQGASNNRVRISTSNSDVVSPIGGHKYLVSAMIKPSISGTYASVYFGGNLTLTVTNLTSGAWNTICGIKTAVNPTGRYLQIDVVGTGTAITEGDTVEIKNYQLFDLTAMLGSTIADYVYTLESGTAGAGIAWLKKYGWFTKPYYAYNSGALLSVRTSAHRTVGFNQWDEQWEVGGMANGVPTSSTNQIRSKNFCKILPDTTYYATCGKTDGGNQNRYYLGVTLYDDNLNFIATVWSNNLTFTTPSNAKYFKITTNSATVVYGATYNHDICINLHWDGERDGEYLPFEAHEYALSDIILRGILKLDASNNLYADGDRYLPDGTVIRKRRQIVADGDTVKVTEVNQSNGTYWCRLTTLSSANKGVNSTTTETRIITDKGYRDYPDVGVGNIYITNNGIAPIICLFDQTLTTVSAVNTYLASNPITIEYELATPTTEAASPYQQTQIVDDFGTEEFVDAATRDFEMPVGHNTVYQPNLRAKLEMAPNSPDGDGDYLVRQTNGVNEYVLFSEVKELPDFPSNDGSYKLRCTVTGGTATLSWVSDS